MLIQNELLNLFDNMYQDTMFSKMNVPDIMRTDSYEYEGNLILEIELPGYEKDEVHAQLKNGSLVIMATKEPWMEEEKKRRNYTFRERHVGGCMRHYYVGEDVKKENIHAAMQNGILKIMIDVTGERIRDRLGYLESHE